MKRLAHNIQSFFEYIWYRDSYWRYILWPLSLIYLFIIKIRRMILTRFSKRVQSPTTIVIGNITVGGTGKTPVVITTADYFIKHGIRVGIISRGYGGKCRDFPHLVKGDDLAEYCGDEPLLMAKRLNCPVVISKDRNLGIKYLVRHYQIELIISDDGLQHYKMPRDFEIIIKDDSRQFVNHFCLPAGPFREPISRLKWADIVLSNHQDLGIKIKPKGFVRMIDNKMMTSLPLDKQIIAVAGIGNPDKFYKTLSELGLTFRTKSFPDHYVYSRDDLYCEDDEIIIMTEKDAVKCFNFKNDRLFYLPVDAILPDFFWDNLLQHIKIKEFKI